MNVGTAAREPIRTLYVDDDESLLDLTAHFLEEREDGIVVETTNSPIEALELVETGDYDVVVSDYQMPEMSGITLLEKLRTERRSDVPFVIFTGRGREEVAIEALNLGADSYLQKGGDPTAQYGVLTQTIRQLTEHRRAQRRLEEREEYLRITLESIGEGVIATDEEGTVVKMNAAAAELTGWPVSEALGEPLPRVFSLVDGRTGESIDPSKAVLQDGGAIELAPTTKLVARDGSERYIEDSFSPIIGDDGGVAGAVTVFRDATDQHRQRAREERQQAALIDLATAEPVLDGEFDTAIRAITERVAETLAVERVSVWLLDEGGHRLTCSDLYERSTGAHSSGAALRASEYPAYFDALEDHRSFGVDDVESSPLTRELYDDYLAPLGITSMLDATLRSGGDVVGVVCHEHVGPKREWEPDEIKFAAEVADNVVIALLRASDAGATLGTR